MHHLLFLVEKADNISKCITVRHFVTLPFQAKNSPLPQIIPTIDCLPTHWTYFTDFLFFFIFFLLTSFLF